MGPTADSKVITPMIRVRKRRDGGTIKYLGWRRGYSKSMRDGRAIRGDMHHLLQPGIN